MPEPPKNKPEIDQSIEEDPESSLWSEDQKRRGYYYDDAHGYEVYKPEEDEEEAED